MCTLFNDSTYGIQCYRQDVCCTHSVLPMLLPRVLPMLLPRVLPVTLSVVLASELLLYCGKIDITEYGTEVMQYNYCRVTIDRYMFIWLQDGRALICVLIFSG